MTLTLVEMQRQVKGKESERLKVVSSAKVCPAYVNITMDRSSVSHRNS